MAKKKDTQPDNIQPPMQPAMPQPGVPMDPNNLKLPKEAQEKLKQIKAKLEKFKKELLKKFDKYITGIALLPPPRPREGEKINKDEIHTLVLIDDSDSQKMTKYELREKLAGIIETIGKEIDKNIMPQTIILTDLWQSCYDGKYELLQLIALGAPIHDNGMLAAIKIAEVHKNMVLKKFERYIVSYVLAGSLVQGKATPTSDIDVFVVIDDTDVKKMTRAELKDKLRAIIIGMGIEAGEITGIKNKINIQVYILTDFWDSIKEANPIIFTFLRDGVPFYDRGIFMPWKQLLKMGKVKPSMEAIDMYMNSGEQVLERVKFKIREIGMEDTFWSILTPTQAALMLYGVPPPTPKETPALIRELFVQKEKLLEDKYVKILENNIQVRKELEHGSKKELTGKEVDQLLKDCEDYLKRIKRLFTQIEKIKEGEDMVSIYDTVVTIIRDVLRSEGIETVNDVDLVRTFEDELISQGKIPAKFLRMLNEMLDAKKDYDDKKLSKTEVEKVKKTSRELIKFLVEYVQRKRGRELERAKVRVKHGSKFGEVLLLGDHAYITFDIDAADKEVVKATLAEDGTMGPTKPCKLEEFEKAITDVKIPQKVFLKEKIFEHLKKIFGKNVEVLVNY